MRSGWWIVALVGAVVLGARVGMAKDVEIRVTDLGTHRPVAGAVVTTQVNSEKKQTNAADADGKVHVVVPEDAKQQPMLRVWAEKAGMVRVSETWWSNKRGDEMPAAWELMLEPATGISGRVVDDAGKGVAGAHVVVEVEKKYADSKQRVSLKNGEVVTDGDGRWSVDAVPAVCDAINLGVWDHQYLTGDGYYIATRFEPQAKLRDGTAETVLHAGTRIAGMVTGLDGKGVEGASVYYNADRRVGNGIPPVKTGADGTFELGIKGGTTAVLEVEKSGFAPERTDVVVGAESPQNVAVKLKEPRVLSGRVVDGDGKGLAEAAVVVHGWGREDLLNVQMKTDAEGRFEWKEAPDVEVTADVYKTGFMAKDNVKMKAGEKNELVMVPPTSVELTVVDAASGEPVRDFHVRDGASWREGDRLLWQTDEADKAGERKGNVLTYTFTAPAAEYAMRVMAEGYYPGDSEKFVPNGGVKRFTIKLEKGESLRGRVVMAGDGNVGEGAVYFISDWARIANGELDDFEKKYGVHGAIDKEGRFVLGPQREKGMLLAITDKGCGYWRVGEWEQLKEFPIQAWGKLEGKLMKGNKGMGSVEVVGAENEMPSNALPAVAWQYGVTTDGEGRFMLDRVWPGSVRFLRWVPNHANGRIMDVTLGQAEVAPGQTAVVQMGGTGRPVVGQLVMGFAGKPWMVRIAEARRVGDAAGEKGTKYSPEIGEDGRFRIEDMPAGDYVLKIALHEFPPGDDCGWGRVLGEYSARFSVPEVPGGGWSGDAVDVGVLTSAALPEMVKVGDVAPEFAVKTLAGSEVRLSELKGKIVLLDFWATWCAPCVAEIPHVKEIADAHAGDSRFVLLGMNEDEETDRLKYFMEQAKITWPQGLLGGDLEVAKRYGATAIPATVLIGADGKVIARDLRGEALKKAVGEALEGEKK